MGARRLLLLTLLVLTAFLAGCSKASRILSRTAHGKYGWKAEDYFNDPQVIALCHAIEANDLDEMKRLIAAGADVNARGKDNMTPLLWAYPDNKIERFKLLLEHGADPNVVVKSSFGTNVIHEGHSVTHLAAGSRFPDHFDLVMRYGGDPNLIDPFYGDSVLHRVITANISRELKKKRIRLLIEKGADLNHLSADSTPAMTAVAWFGQYDIALMLIKAGADPCKYRERSNSRLIHSLAREQRDGRAERCPPELKQAYNELLKIVEERCGVTLEQALKDLDRWAHRAMVYEPAEIKRLREQEVAERKAREKAKQTKTQQTDRNSTGDRVPDRRNN
ncbi:MAG: ankyrin [Planctomycetes bacterium]|nr:ankyrin [Planctomycetota bacterium]